MSVFKTLDAKNYPHRWSVCWSMIAHRWRRSAVDVGDQALMRGLATALPRCVWGCPYLTSGVEQVGHIASIGNSPAVAPSPPVRERWRLRRAGFSIQIAAVGGTSIATAHMKPASSRAIAVQATVVFFPRAENARYRAVRRV